MIVDTLLERGSGSIPEDALLVDAPCFGVFDGATSIDDAQSGGNGGARASAAVRAEFARAGSCSLLEVAERANQRVGKLMDDALVDRMAPTARWGTTAAVVRVAGAELEWLRVGDSVVLLILADGTHRTLGEYEDHDRETKLARRALGQMDHAIAMHALAGDLKRVRALANVSYGVLDGHADAMLFVRHGREPLVAVRHVLVFTDGLIPPKTDPDEPEEWGALVAAFGTGGLAGGQALVRDRERADPDCIIYPRLKPHDDIAAIALTF